MIIDKVYEAIIQKLTSEGNIKDVSETLFKFDNNEDRVLYVHTLITNLDFFPPLKESKKCNDLSTQYRLLGNQCYSTQEYYKAWQYYNLSLLNATLDSNYATALFNRSAVLFTLMKYKACMQEINLFFTMNYPEKLKDKMIKRRELCEEGLRNAKVENENLKIVDILSFKGNRDETYLCASSKLAVVYNKDMGRHVVAKENINVGEVVAVEEPYFPLLLKGQVLFSCSYCLSREEHLIPCESCSYALYCNEECRKKAWEEYHAVECPLMATLFYMKFTKIELLALRTVIKARTDHSDWESLFETIEEADATVNTEYHGHVKISDKWVYDSKHYASIHTLATNVDKRSVSDIFQKSVTAAVLLNFLIKNTHFLNIANKELELKASKCVAGLLLLHGMTSPTNMHGIAANSDTNGNKQYVSELSLASGAYPFHSLLNHSCAPNVVRFNKLGTATIKLFALRPIKKGMQIFDNYGEHHAVQQRTERRTSLKFQYKFTCMCEACVNNWPPYISMMPLSRIRSKIIEAKNKYLSLNIIDQLQNGDAEAACKLFKELCKLCEGLECYSPCVELCDCQEGMKQCLSIFGGLVPYGYNTSVDWPITKA